MIRTLIHKDTGESYTITLDQTTLITQSEAQKTELKLSSPLEGTRTFEKKEWEQLKKGFVYSIPEAQQGKPRLHQFIQRAYTGCLSMVDLKDKIGVYRHQNFDNDILDLFQCDGTYLKALTLPKALPWSLRYMVQHQLLIMDVDHYIYGMDLVTEIAAQWTSGFETPASFISTSKSLVFYGASPNIFLKDVAKNDLLFTREMPLENFGGHTPVFQGCLSEDEQQLAICTRPGAVDLLDLSGELIKTIEGNFQIADKMEFLDNTTLLIKEKYGTGGLRLFDLESGEELLDKIHKTPNSGGKYVDSFDLDRKNNRLLITNRAKATVYQLPTFEPLLSFPIEHCVKQAQAIFTGDNTVSVRTDYGCFSMYSV